MGYSSINCGHCNPDIIEAAYSQMKKLHQTHVQLNIPTIKLSEKLAQITPGDYAKRIHYDVGGTGACELAMKITRNYTEKKDFIAFTGGYHGRALGTSALSAGWQYRHGFKPVAANVWRFPYPYCYRCLFGKEYPDCDMFCVQYMERFFESVRYGIADPSTKENDIAGLWVEPIEGNAGYIIPPDEFYPRLRKLCDEHYIPLIDDEVQMAFGRTGKMFCCENYNTIPDIIILGKSLTGGMWPQSAVIAPTKYFEDLRHLVTFSENPLGCATALAAIDVIEKEKLCDRSSKMGEYFLKGLKDLEKDHKLVGEVQGKGLAIGIEFVKNKKTKEPASEETNEIKEKALSKGLILVRQGIFYNRLSIIPYLKITKEQVDKAIEILDECISEVERKL